MPAIMAIRGHGPLLQRRALVTVRVSAQLIAVINSWDTSGAAPSPQSACTCSGHWVGVPLRLSSDQREQVRPSYAAFSNGEVTGSRGVLS